MAQRGSARRMGASSESPDWLTSGLSEELLSRIRAGGAASDECRNPDPQLMAELGRLGLVRLLVPAELGGLGVHPAEFIEFTRQVTYQHPSTGWAAMTCNEEAEIFAAHFEAATVAAFYAENPSAVIAGSGVPRGVAQPADGGWTVDGRWSFVSGCTAAHWWVLANVVEGPPPRDICHILLPADPTLVEDTWHTVGLRGTGSHDVVLRNQFIPAERSAVVAAYDLPKPNEHPYYRLPSGLRFPFPKTGVAAGIADRAIDEFKLLASSKTPLFAKSSLANRPDAHAAVAKAEALTGAARSFVADQLDEIWQTAAANGEVTAEQHARARLACSWAVQNCIAAVEALATASGSTANFIASPLGTLLNDARAVAGHFMVGSQQIDTAGRVLLGLDPDDRNF